VQILLSDPTRANEVLGWAPTVSLEEGLAATAEWLRPRVDPETAGRYHR
jgi:UDP-glucose 4-epimerase